MVASMRTIHEFGESGCQETFVFIAVRLKWSKYNSLFTILAIYTRFNCVVVTSLINAEDVIQNVALQSAALEPDLHDAFDETSAHVIKRLIAQLSCQDLSTKTGSQALLKGRSFLIFFFIQLLLIPRKCYFEINSKNFHAYISNVYEHQEYCLNSF